MPEKIVQRIQEKIEARLNLRKQKNIMDEIQVSSLSLENHDICFKGQTRQDTKVDSIYLVRNTSLGGCIGDPIGEKNNANLPMQSFSSDQAHRKIAMVMQKNMVHNYTQTAKDIQTINAFLVSDVPLDWILSETQRQFDIRPDCRHKARSFGYMAEILIDSWQCELAKKAPAEPLHFESYRRTSSRRQQKRAGRPETKATPTASVQDERYANFYRLFPEEACYDNSNKAVTAAADDKRYEAFYGDLPQQLKAR